MDITPLTGAYDPAKAGQTKAATAGADIFSTDGFLNLLAAQIRNQNPLEPLKDTEFIAQMAQFSQLEQTTGLARDIRGLTMGQQLSQGAALIGRTVTYDLGDGNVATGVVERLSVSADGRDMMLRIGEAVVDIRSVVTVDS